MAPARADRPRGAAAQLLVGGAIAGLALLAVAVVLPGRGWPYNHDGLSAFERTESFRRAFLAGDLFPTWSPFCFNGHGTPGPFFYHRLFYTVSGGLAAAGLSALRVMRGERAGVAPGTVWALLFYAHIVLWLYATIFVALAFAAALVAQRATWRRDPWAAPAGSSPGGCSPS